MKKSKRVSVSFIGLLLACCVHGQVILDGMVVDKDNLPVIGATVVVKSTTVGVVTGIDGKFHLTLENTLPATLTVSFLGYEEVDTDVYEAGKEIRVVLMETAENLDEVVVIGYGTQRRRELTGAVGSVSKQYLEYNTAPSLDALLGGAVAGVNVTQSSGQPGAASSIRIRGGNSVNASNDPLYVIDGIIVYPRSTNAGAGGGEVAVESSINPLAAINPATIESISVLKDVSATAIFGSRGANGVIIVTTKKGRRDKNIINYTLTTGWSIPSRHLRLMDATQWARVQIDYFGNKGNITGEQLAQIGHGYDWQDAVLQTGFRQNHDISVSGGDEKTRYLLSGNFIDQSGIIINSGFRRYNIHIKIDRDIYQNLTIGTSTTFGKSNQNSLTTSKEVNYNSSPFGDGITNSLTYALFMPPTVPIYNADGSYNYLNPWESSHFSLNGRQANPVSDLNNSVAESINNSILANVYALYTIRNGLVAKLNLSTDQSSITQNFFAPSTSALGLNEVGVGSIGKKQHEIWQADATIDYSRQFNDSHFINFLGGYTYQHVHENYLINRASHFTNETLKHNNLGDGQVQTPTLNGIFASQLHSIITRLNYTLQEKYNLTATFRADYSDRFAPGKRWGYFPSIGVSWNIDKEKFLQEQSLFSTLKLRLSAGGVGNTEIGDYLFAQIFRAQKYNGQTVYQMDNLGNPDLTWETTTQYNLGLDGGLMEDHLNFSLDLYHKNTYNLLLEKPAPLGSGVDKQMVNIGNVQNKGVEFGVNAILIDKGKLRWDISANIARNINAVTALGDDDRILSGQYSEQILKVGESFGSFYGFIFDGIVQSGEDISQLPLVNGSTPQPGDVKFVDIQKDGSIDLNDRVILGSIHPDFIYGLSSSLIYRNFDFFASFQGSQGNEVVNSLRRNLERATSSYNLSAALLDAWTPDNPSNEIPRISAGYQMKFIDNRHVEDASYFRMKNLTIGYNIPKVKNLRAGVRIFLSAENLFTITAYKGYDPEVANGIDVGAYPSARTFSVGFGLNIY